MSFVTGTASNYLDLLARFKTFATTDATLVGLGQNWTLLGDATAPGEVLTLQGPGLAGTDTIIVTISPYQDTGADYFNWRLGGAISYDAGPPEAWFGASPGANNLAPCILLHNDPMQYWFRGDGRSLSATVKVSSVYQTLHLGLILPYATPGQWPLPLMVGGTTAEQTLRWSDTTDDNSAFFDAFRMGPEGSYNSALILRDAAGNWLDFWTRDNQSATDGRWILPRRYAVGANILTKALEPIGDCYPTEYLELSGLAPEVNNYGIIDGWLWTTGHGLSAEDIVPIGGVDHLAVPNVFRGEKDRWALMRLG